MNFVKNKSTGHGREFWTHVESIARQVRESERSSTLATRSRPAADMESIRRDEVEQASLVSRRGDSVG
jgi:hypothetical protein